MIGDRPRILIVGDVMVDRHVQCAVDRLSPEAPVPIARIEEATESLGGAANVAKQVAMLGGAAVLVSVWSPDAYRVAITDFEAADESGGIEMLGPTESDGTTKTRYFAGTHQLLRVDEDVDPSTWADETRRKLREAVEGLIEGVDLVVVSDYCKGVVTDEIAELVMAKAREFGKPVVVDSKRKSYYIFSGAALITPNEAEARTAVGAVKGDDAGSLLSFQSYGGFGHVLLTRSELGVALFRHGARVATFGATVFSGEVVDVTGAGDVVVGVAAFALASGYDAVDAAYQANIAAGISVTVSGCYQPDPEDLDSADEYRRKILAYLDEFPTRIDLFRRMRERAGHPFRVTLLNGCFDGLHAGHHRLIDAAPADSFVVVAVNSDESVRNLKGEDRPIVGECERVLALARKARVDLVVAFGTESDLEDIIHAARPDVVVKGAEYEGREITGAELLAEWGGRVEYVPMLEGVSTTILAGGSE